MYLLTDIIYHHDHLFLTDGNVKIRYGDLVRLHSHVQDEMDGMSRKKLTCGINTENRLHAMLWMVFCWMQNVPFVPYHSSHTEPVRSFHPGILTDQLTDLNDLITGSAFTKAGSYSSPEMSNIDESLNARFNPFQYPAESIFSGLLTSGSTGKPRKVPLRRGQMIAAAGNSLRSDQITLSERNTLWGNCLPLNHAGGMAIIFRALLSGTGVFLWDHFDAELISHDLAYNPDIKRLSLVPTMLKRLLDVSGDHSTPLNDIKSGLSDQHSSHHKKSQQETSQPDNLAMQRSSHSLENVLVGGGPAPGKLIQRARKLGWPVIFSYGMTETCGQVAVQNVIGTSPDDSVGCPFTDHIVTVRDDNGQNLNAGKTGTIWIKGPQVFSGYLSETEDLPGNSQVVAHLNPSESDSNNSWNSTGDSRSANRNIETGTHLSILDNSCYLNTGDFGHFDLQGNLYVESRRTDLVISGGVNIRPAEIEDVLLRCPFVTDAGVTGISDEEWGQRLIALIVPTAETKNLSLPKIKTSILEYLSNKVKPHQLPKSIYLVEAIPRTGIGKIKRDALLKQAINQPAER